MNKYFYKYTKLRPNFFEDLMLRATPFKALNDPFEGCFNKKQLIDTIENIENDSHANQGGNIHKLKDEYEIDGLLGVMQSNFDDVGVLSFTEDYTNPLMWAHYADEHRGMVLEFDYEQPLFQDSIKMINERMTRFGKNILGDIYEFPQKVMYRREMPSFDRMELSVPNLKYVYPWKNFLYTLFLTKANDWIYEKELRSIVRLRDADSIICEKSKDILRVCSQNKEIKVHELDGNQVQIIYPREYEMHEDMGDESIKGELYSSTLNYSNPPIHLFRINPLAISGVYFGCKSVYYEELKSIRNNAQLKYMKNNINKMVIDHSQYQLRNEKI